MSVRSSRVVAVALVTAATFIDLVAYSIAVPVLPDLSLRLGASPTVIGLLFASFGVTVLGVSVPMGVVSDRVGRKLPMVAGMLALAASSLLLALADRLQWLFTARLVQGAADAVTWVVGLALIADLYGPDERGRVIGLVMSGANFGFMIGPTLGGWLYETGGITLPFVTLAGAAVLFGLGFLWLRLPDTHDVREAVPTRDILRVPAVASCALAVVAAACTIAMLEPVLPLFLSTELHMGPARIGLVFGIAAVASTGLHPLFGRLADLWGGRRLMLVGLLAIGSVLPFLSFSRNFGSAVALYIAQAVAVSLVVTPSLAFMAEAISAAGVQSFGVAYGVYNFAWALGLLAGPAAGGFMYEWMGFERLTAVWGPAVIVMAALLARRMGPRG
jgi:MFS transporter, DHA1 family, solute carrier family 18 (vesicular amine transporter), member 1/2